MKKRGLACLILILISFSFFVLNGCSKGGSDNKPSDSCAGITITVAASATAADAGLSNGSIVATGAGSTGFTYSLNNGAFQSSGTFNNLAAGKYTITAKNTNGCSGAANVTVVSKDAGCAGKTPGPLFTAVKAVVTSNCAVSGCHNGTQAPDYRVDCTIVDYADLIKLRAVDQANTADQMPQPPRMALAQSDRDKITAWITAGKRITD
jgi:hypothetical protein